MAVAVEQVPNLVLDEKYRIIDVGPSAEAVYGSLRGRGLWEVFPSSRPLFEPYYEKARLSGEPVEFVQYYNGRVASLRVVPQSPHLHVYWEMIHSLDTLTLDGLRASLEQTITAIEEQETRSRRSDLVASLTVIEGGAGATT